MSTTPPLPLNPNRAPDLADSLATFFDRMASEIHTSLPGKIVKVNGALVDVQPTLMRVYVGDDGTENPVEYPVLTDRPVAWPGGGGCYLTFPIAVGDPCVLWVAQQSLDAWLETDAKTPIDPGEAARHHFGNAFVYPLGGAARGAIPNISTADAVLGLAGSAKLHLGSPSAAHGVGLGDGIASRLAAIESWIGSAVSTAAAAVGNFPNVALPVFTADTSAVKSAKVLTDA